MGWRDNLRNPKNLGAIKGPHGHASQPHLSVHAKGGRAGFAHGMGAARQAIKRITERLGGGEEGKPHSTRAGRMAAGVRRIKRFTDKKRGLGRADISSIRKGLKSKAGAFKTHGKDVPTMAAEGGRIGFKKGTDKK